MIIFLIIGVVVIFGALEILSLKLPERAVHTRVETDLKLCTPEEEVVLYYTVANSSFLPLLHVGISIPFDKGISVCPPEATGQKWTLSGDFFGTHVEQKMRLKPHGVCTGQVRFRIEQRGMHTLGEHYVGVGDYLGVSEFARKEEGDIRIVCTPRRWEDEEDLRPLGGLLGEISVLRFIHEDPCILAGFRDYTGREPMKQISWVQSAKTGKLTVKQQDHTADADVAVLVNTEGRDRAALERCLSLTRSVCEQLEAMRIPYVFRSNGDLWDVAEGIGRSHLFPILRSLGLSRLACFTPFGALVDRCIREGRASRTYIVISSETPAALKKLQAYSEHRVVSFSVKGDASE